METQVQPSLAVRLFTGMCLINEVTIKQLLIACSRTLKHTKHWDCAVTCNTRISGERDPALADTIRAVIDKNIPMAAAASASLERGERQPIESGGGSEYS